MPSALQKFLFGEGTPDTYESLQSKRAMAERYAASLSQAPQNLGQGLSALGRAYASRKLMDQANTGDAKGKADFGSAFGRIMAGREAPQAPQTGAMGDYAAAISKTESGGNYQALGPVMQSGSYAGDRAYGKYQVMGKNIPQWTREVLGREMTPQEFLADQNAQDAVFNAKFGASVEKYGNPQDAASVWFSGRPMAQAGNASDGYNTVPQYVEKFNKNLGVDQGPSVQELVGAMGNPYATPAQKMALGTMLQQKLAANQPMSPQDQLDMEYRRAQIEALKAKQAAAGNQSTEYGLTPQYGVDEKGNPVLIQIGKDGTAVRTPLPDGVSLSKQPIKMDAGTHFVLLDPITRQPVGTIPKDNRGEASEKAVGTATGKAQGEAIVNLGSAIAGAESAIKVIDEIYNDPNLESVTGMIQGRLPPLTQGGTDLVTKIDQAKGKVFMEAYTTLKGGGQITEVEGKKAEQAIARLNRAQSVEAYKAALDDLKDVINKGLARAKEKAGVVSAPPPAQPAIIPSTAPPVQQQPAQVAPPAPQPSDQSDPLGLFN